MLEALEQPDGSAPVQEHLEEEPLALPAVSKFSAALRVEEAQMEAPLTVELEGQRASVSQVMLEGLGHERCLKTRVDIRNLNFSVPVAPPSALPFVSSLPLPFVKRPPMKYSSILKEITFSLLPGETTLLLGGPRSGKTSLLECIAGRAVAGVSGEVFVNGAPPEQAYQRMVSCVPAFPFLPI